MGIMTCNRNGCNNIMCDRHSHEFGYICNDCFDELVKSGPTTDIAQFMGQKPRKVNTDAALARFNVEFLLTNQD